MRFDAAKMLATSSGVLKSSALTSLEVVLKSQEALLCQRELARVLGKVFEKLAKRLETCHCHEHVWGARMPFKRQEEEVYTGDRSREARLEDSNGGRGVLLLGWTSS